MAEGTAQLEIACNYTITTASECLADSCANAVCSGAWSTSADGNDKAPRPDRRRPNGAPGSRSAATAAHPETISREEMIY